MKKQHLFIFLLTFLSVQSWAQKDESIKLIEDERIQEYLNRYNYMVAVESTPEYVYRIKLIDTFERPEAQSTQAKFRSLYPNEPVKLDYDGVKFVVRACEFTSKADAEVKLREIKKEFPSAFLLPAQKVKK